MTHERERWRKAPGFPGYRVSSRGRVRFVDRVLSDGRRAGGVMLTARPDRDGYPCVTIGGKRAAVHRLVAAAFLGPCPPGQEVRHKDDDRGNPAAVNLVYGTHRDNERDKRRGDKGKKGQEGQGTGEGRGSVSRPSSFVTSVTGSGGRSGDRPGRDRRDHRVAGVAGVAGVIRARIRSHGVLVLAWRWLTGSPWHGREVTDAGWLRPATRALTRTGHAPRFHHRPRLHRTAMRAGPALAVLLLLCGLAASPALTARAAAAGLTAAVVLAVLRAVLAVRRRRHRRTWADPLHLALAPKLGIAVAQPSATYLTIAPDRSKVTLALPPGWTGSRTDREDVAGIVSAKLGLESPDVSWQLAGPKPRLTLSRSHPPPALVGLDDVQAAVERARPDELVLGVGKRGQVVTGSLAADSPHIGLSMGSGGGKSTLAAFLLMQELHRGALALVLDGKWISHPWLNGLPNVAYARTPHEMHQALAWLGAELLDRRNRVALLSVDVNGRIRANVGPRIFIVAEELNLAMPKLRALWQDIRARDDPVRSRRWTRSARSRSPAGRPGCTSSLSASP
ncbi:MAG: NUMOD4 motif-containing HNH endonuclease [Streptosporangiaceae bacterium]